MLTKNKLSQQKITDGTSSSISTAHKISKDAYKMPSASQFQSSTPASSVARVREAPAVAHVAAPM
jgi:hypothetical protein